MPAKKTASKSKISAPAAKKAAPKKAAPVVAKKAAAPKKAAPVAAKKTVAPKKAAPVVAKKVVAPKAAPAAKKVAPKKATTGVFVRFERFSPNSERVDLVGSFNGWELGKHGLSRDESGVWSTQIRLAPGTYEYKYVYDGQYYEPDPAQEQVANAFGSANNLLIVT